MKLARSASFKGFLKPHKIRFMLTLQKRKRISNNFYSKPPRRKLSTPMIPSNTLNSILACIRLLSTGNRDYKVTQKLEPFSLVNSIQSQTLNNLKTQLRKESSKLKISPKFMKLIEANDEDNQTVHINCTEETSNIVNAVEPLGAQVAYGDQKFGIKATGLLSVLGSVTYDHNNSSYVIENPILLATSKDRVLSNLGHQINKLLKERDFWAVCTLGFGMWLFWEYNTEISAWFSRLWADVKNKFGGTKIGSSSQTFPSQVQNENRSNFPSYTQNENTFPSSSQNQTSTLQGPQAPSSFAQNELFSKPQSQVQPGVPDEVQAQQSRQVSNLASIAEEEQKQP